MIDLDQECLKQINITDTYCMYGCDQAWDGKINNSSEYAITGNYVYNIVIIDFNGKERTFEGTVTLNR